MIEAAQQVLQRIVEYFLDGFLALLALAVAAPLLGVLLVLRRMPLLALAIPELAGSGQAGAVFVCCLVGAGDATGEPDAVVRYAGALFGVGLGLSALLAVSRDRRFLGVHAGVAYLLAIALREVFELHSPPAHAADGAIRQGRLLTVGPGGRYLVIGCCAAVLAAAVLSWRRSWLSAFDPDQARLLGIAPGRQTALTLLLAGALCGLCVPVVGPEVVLTLLLVPAAVLRSAVPSLHAYAPLAIAAGFLGSAAAFLLSCAEAVDWPPGPALVLCVLASSLLLAGLLMIRSRIRRPGQLPRR